MPDPEQAITPIEGLLNGTAGALAPAQEVVAQARQDEGMPLHAIGNEPRQEPPERSGSA